VNPLDFKIVARPGRVRAHLSERVIPQLQSAFFFLFINRGRTFRAACDDAAEHYYDGIFLRDVELLEKKGLISVEGGKITLETRAPQSPLEWLARCAE